MIPASFLIAVRADRFTDFGEEQAQQIGDFGRRADGRARRANRILLFDGNGGADVGDAVDVGAIHLVEKHARIGRKGFDIAPLSFRKQCVEGEGRFAGSRQAGNRRDLVVGDTQRDIFQIVLTCPFDDQFVG